MSIIYYYLIIILVGNYDISGVNVLDTNDESIVQSYDMFSKINILFYNNNNFRNVLISWSKFNVYSRQFLFLC